MRPIHSIQGKLGQSILDTVTFNSYSIRSFSAAGGSIRFRLIKKVMLIFGLIMESGKSATHSAWKLAKHFDAKIAATRLRTSAICYK
jgi:hypothetical protein